MTTRVDPLPTGSEVIAQEGSIGDYLAQRTRLSKGGAGFREAPRSTRRAVRAGYTEERGWATGTAHTMPSLKPAAPTPKARLNRPR